MSWTDCYDFYPNTAKPRRMVIVAAVYDVWIDFNEWGIKSYNDDAGDTGYINYIKSLYIIRFF